ncbi:MAG: alanine racemase [Anaerolineae bacterium]|nr:alanine racemase [Thermoflexales bacterium]MDW8406392.1 alanine racemase [Anaerolineae bacterium]
MIHLTDLLAATQGRLCGFSGDGRSPVRIEDVQFSGFCFDSRRAHAGELFTALKTDRGDGHDYIADAVARGCAGVLVEEGRFSAVDSLSLAGKAPYIIVVPNTLSALIDYGRYIVRRRSLPVVAITGSLGKSSTREAVAAVLSKRFSVFRNPANFNGRLGLSIALGGLEDHHQILVLEMGTDAPGEIGDLCEIAPPQVGIVTNVSESHLAYFGSLDAIAREKASLVEALPPDGLAILNADDPRVWAMRARTRATVIAARARHAPADGLTAPGDGLKVEIAHAVGRHFGIPDAEIEAALAHVPPLPGRMNSLAGVNGCLLLDDSFNANPTSMRAAIESAIHRWQSSIANGQSVDMPSTLWLVLGDMDQLGDHSRRYHHEIGVHIARLGREHTQASIMLVTLGERAQDIAAGALEEGMPAERVKVTYVARDVVNLLQRQVAAGDVVLVKGDTGARMERVVAALLANPSDKSKLARQEPGWESVRITQPERPTWLEVDLDAIAHNTRLIKQIIGPDVALMAVLKADGYGHGAVKVARTALNNGAVYCGVASLNEAAALRAANIDAPILILGYTPAWHAREALLRDVTVTIYDLDIARAFSRAAIDLQRPARVHIKIDTGMGRLGVLPKDAVDFIEAVAELPGIEIEGMFTHFSCADTDPDFTRVQLTRFLDIVGHPRLKGRTPKWRHAANSAATLTLPETRLNMVRVGLALYGLSPFAPDAIGQAEAVGQLKPALVWKTTISQVKTLPDGAPVSYGATYRCQGERRIAVIPVGYADGFRRAPQHFGEVLVRGRRAPIVGRVCMDQTMLDVTDIPGVRIGDEVVLIGQQGTERITAEDVAARIGTINYEVVSAILPRVPRVT